MTGEVMKIERSEYLALKKENSALTTENKALKARLKSELAENKKQTIKKGA